MALDTPESSSSAVMASPRSQFKIRQKKMKRRTRIPDRPDKPANLWSILKNCIGKDLTKIPVPVNFSEPLSILQRITENFMYSNLLDQAALCEDSLEQLAHLAVFTISNYSTTAHRTTKPFNPLLGETFEWDRSDDYGWRIISEQVSHHPPIAAQYCESRNWTSWQEFSISAKFRGKYVVINPLGISHIIFHKSGNHYTWTKVVTTINNVIIGKLWIDNSGQSIITNHTNSSVCNVDYIPYSIFRPDDQKKVYGQVMSSDGEVKWIINGRWDDEVTISPVVSVDERFEQPEYKLGQSRLIWKAEVPSEESKKYYRFSVFASQMNELEDDIAPTDSRLRPDQRLMEEGRWDEANTMKIALENKQRHARKQYIERSSESDIKALSFCSMESSSDTGCSTSVRIYEPYWFKRELDPLTGKFTYVYKGGYWEAKEKKQWSNCPQIYV